MKRYFMIILLCLLSQASAFTVRWKGIPYEHRSEITFIITAVYEDGQHQSFPYGMDFQDRCAQRGDAGRTDICGFEAQELPLLRDKTVSSIEYTVAITAKSINPDAVHIEATFIDDAPVVASQFDAASNKRVYYLQPKDIQVTYSHHQFAIRPFGAQRLTKNMLQALAEEEPVDDRHDSPSCWSCFSGG